MTMEDRTLMPNSESRAPEGEPNTTPTTDPAPEAATAPETANAPEAAAAPANGDESAPPPSPPPVAPNVPAAAVDGVGGGETDDAKTDGAKPDDAKAEGAKAEGLPVGRLLAAALAAFFLTGLALEIQDYLLPKPPPPRQTGPALPDLNAPLEGGLVAGGEHQGLTLNGVPFESTLHRSPEPPATAIRQAMAREALTGTPVFREHGEDHLAMGVLEGGRHVQWIATPRAGGGSDLRRAVHDSPLVTRAAGTERFLEDVPYPPATVIVYDIARPDQWGGRKQAQCESQLTPREAGGFFIAALKREGWEPLGDMSKVLAKHGAPSLAYRKGRRQLTISFYQSQTVDGACDFMINCISRPAVSTTPPRRANPSR